ncbi:hypothetical protein P7K49_018595 [Saguinus oedipus]|uniref:Uncharacterized protein n=1 Tax=Saguinus oedipus TaxID=9490 RepID=A0ABQ9V713_SAGOE|nr:hypothetical protein P7K49_018595 [Saguinus oedipus]
MVNGQVLPRPRAPPPRHTFSTGLLHLLRPARVQQEVMVQSAGLRAPSQPRVRRPPLFPRTLCGDAKVLLGRSIALLSQRGRGFHNHVTLPPNHRCAHAVLIHPRGSAVVGMRLAPVQHLQARIFTQKHPGATHPAQQDPPSHIAHSPEVY